MLSETPSPSIVGNGKMIGGAVAVDVEDTEEDDGRE